MTHRVLVVGYGNELRADDGVGAVVATALLDEARCPGAVVLVRQQLTPELCADLAGTETAIFLDADPALAAGAFEVRALRDDRAGCEATAGTSSHHVDPATLVALASELYGARPRAVVVAIGVASFEPGAPMTPAVVAGLPAIVDAAAALANRAATATVHA
jgi:hydrogenase maturation protease